MQVMDKGDWKAIKVGNNGPTMSHPMFTDNLLLFREETARQMQYVMSIMNKLCIMSEEQVSNEKT